MRRVDKRGCIGYYGKRKAKEQGSTGIWNKEKSVVAYISKVKFLGYGFYIFKGKCRFKLHEKSKRKMKRRLCEILNRNKGISNEARQRRYMQYIRGWLQYFKLADMKAILKNVDEWIRRRVRAVYWKQWKKVKTGERH